MKPSRRKYRFPGPSGRKEAEAQLQRVERERMHLYWYAVALEQGRITWTERDEEHYRFASFSAVPDKAWTSTLIVSEFSPPSNHQMPSLHVMDEDMLAEELRIRMSFGDWWFVQGVEAAQRGGAA